MTALLIEPTHRIGVHHLHLGVGAQTLGCVHLLLGLEARTLGWTTRKEVDEGPPDQIFEGAGDDPHDHSGEPNLEGPRIPEPRAEDKEVFDSHRET
jgi:hypothetical protein